MWPLLKHIQTNCLVLLILCVVVEKLLFVTVSNCCVLIYQQVLLNCLVLLILCVVVEKLLFVIVSNCCILIY